ncbi:hypothetical protein Pmar_PMAR026093 [Perkinsus marinus ATCC 50983]|uniref:Uncharacterized protein n=2 Tax=Perkinsus marinus TaxID=31276 RepID=C5KWF1_PERM5|nr:hypothetical protein Pmar_PMAR026093 [Perkinsus marinus ATCC 50983]ABY27191.1 unknown protein [Perkinsus marinus]EER11192.1 hypothetical protein Pmar_PMAR026093 [Perkinsus marinus ATCC 50983]|eukprot:XP_002779397.1 hypothetical protein Pmar_PMAR026093 [Perkinsus marinus ATCC 50983]
MRILVGLIVAVAVNAIPNSKPSGFYCGSLDTSPKGRTDIGISMSDSHEFDIKATSISYTSGSVRSGIEHGVPYSYDDSTKYVTVTDTSKLQDLITKIDASLKASDLARLRYDGTRLFVVALKNSPLDRC